MTEYPFIDDLIRDRRAKRGFLNRPVSVEMVKDILSAAKYAPSSSNCQPWHCYVITGQARERIVDSAVEAYRASPDGLIPEYPFFPQPLHDPFATRFNVFRGQYGNAMGCCRSDKDGRRRDVERQFRFFGAPVGVIFTMDKRLEWASFLCYGAFLQNIMLAAKGRGLDTCPQQIWALQHSLLRTELNLSEHQMVVAGMSIGWADNSLPENQMTISRLQMEEFTTFVDE